MASETFKVNIGQNLAIEVDYKRCDCRREPAHCHITRRGRRVAQVWVDPVRIESGHDLDRNEVNLVYDEVSRYEYEIKRVYEHNQEYGSEY